MEDDTDIASVLRRSLDKEGYEVRVAGDGEAALKESGYFEPDAVVLDLGLPRLDGVEVCRRLREDGDVPILILTARDGARRARGGPRLGRRRLPGQALRARRAAGAHARPAAAPARRAAAPSWWWATFGSIRTRARCSAATGSSS